MGSKIKKVLISQREPQTKSYYNQISEKFGLKLDFVPLIETEGLEAKEFRKSRVYVQDHSAVIFTNTVAVDNFFRLCKETRTEITAKMKYFCISESISFYLQKYIPYRKRRIYLGNNTLESFIDIISENSDEKFFMPVSALKTQTISKKLEKLKIDFNTVVMYKTVTRNFKEDIKDINDYDIILFFSPAGITSLKDNYPEFEQKKIIIGASGKNTCSSVKRAKFRLDIKAPSKKFPSILMALEDYLKKNN